MFGLFIELLIVFASQWDYIYQCYFLLNSSHF